MTVANIVSSGTVTVTNGSTNVTARGTSFRTALVTGGTLLVGGAAAFIRSVSSETRLVLTRPWPAATAANASYEISRERAEAASVIAANDRLAQAVTRLDTLVLPGEAEAGGVGTYMFARSRAAAAVTFGQDVDGTSLDPAGTGGAVSAQSPAGIWKCMGHAASDQADITLWLRIR